MPEKNPSPSAGQKKTLPPRQASTFMKAGATLKTKIDDPDREASTPQTASGPVAIVQRHFARALRMYEMYCDGEQISKIAEKFGLSFEEAAYFINNYYAYKLRHDPSLKRHVRDTIKTQVAMLANHYFIQAMGTGSDAKKSAEVYLKICNQVAEFYNLRNGSPKPGEGNQPAGTNNFQFNFGNGVSMPEPYEMHAQIRQAIGAPLLAVDHGDGE